MAPQPKLGEEAKLMGVADAGTQELSPFRSTGCIRGYLPQYLTVDHTSKYPLGGSLDRLQGKSLVPVTAQTVAGSSLEGTSRDTLEVMAEGMFQVKVRLLKFYCTTLLRMHEQPLLLVLDDSYLYPPCLLLL